MVCRASSARWQATASASAKVWPMWAFSTPDAIFAKIASGVLKAHIGQTFALADAVKCHQALEARQTIGSSLLMP